MGGDTMHGQSLDPLGVHMGSMRIPVGASPPDVLLPAHLRPLLAMVFRSGGDASLDVPVPAHPDTSEQLLASGGSGYRNNYVIAAQKRRKAEAHSLWCDTLNKLSIADFFRNRIFWMPHNLDFRGRAYTISPHLTHIGNDKNRAMLCFAKGKPLGPDGLHWLKLQVVNLTVLPVAPEDIEPMFHMDVLHKCLVKLKAKLGSHFGTERDVPREMSAYLDVALSISENLYPYLAQHSSSEGELLSNVHVTTREAPWQQFHEEGKTQSRLDSAQTTGHLEGMLLRILATASGARRALEVGAFTGYGTLSLAEGLPLDGEVVTIEREPFLVEMNKRTFANSVHGHKIKQLCLPAIEALEKLSASNEKFDLVFIDAAKIEYVHYYRLIRDNLLNRPRGLIIVDNVLWHGGMFYQFPPNTSGDMVQSLEGILEFNRLVSFDESVLKVMLPVRDGMMLIVPKPRKFRASEAKKPFRAAEDDEATGTKETLDSVEASKSVGRYRSGKKKRDPISQRLQWLEENLEQVFDSADRPLEGNRWWADSDDPWQTLAACMELTDALRSPNPETFVSHLPVHQDGSCNGLQHYAALGRDMSGGRSVNLLPDSVPRDVYSDVAAVVEAIRAQDEAAGMKVAEVLNGHISRKVIKQTVMTTVYGVTKFGARQQIYRQLKEREGFPKSETWLASFYLTTAVFQSLGEMFRGAQQIQDWLTDCAGAISKIQRQPVQWTTPLGLPVVQPYFKAPGRPNTVKQRNAFPPNYIHSLDATHMMLTALGCGYKGITFVSVHDCFWTHAADVTQMNKASETTRRSSSQICRNQFVALHSEPLLEELSEEFVRLFSVPESLIHGNKTVADTEKRRLNRLLLQIPAKGSLPLKAVKKSIYFFS
ncbi:unnamed protein product [Cyprideis torosa]|uniref:DNA-directed RNA polymerase n=1 Tax=Cyprideis torosa TaxID=163714 RepID=A0A7R8WBT5_9CRUS|nr:unnamed protein product [Cyprideis torosa]CAG0892609.1 unnamed protein product [Cyprideis torosa]